MQNSLNYWQKVYDKIEPEAAGNCDDSARFYVSVAISLKRIADCLEALEKRVIEFYSQKDKEF